MGIPIDPARADTKTRLLEAAGPAFARLGFHGATLQQICEAAGANIAAANYHFGDKAGLYRSVLRYSRDSAAQSRPHPAAGAPGTANAHLALFVRTLLEHLFGQGRPAWFAQIIAREMVDPTTALRELIEEETRPGFERLKQIVSEIVGIPAHDEQVLLCANSIVGQCLHYFHSRPVVQELWPQLQMDSQRIDQIARHVTDFSLYALKQLRTRYARSHVGHASARKTPS